jgi:para-nitrobenzyl esterase
VSVVATSTGPVRGDQGPAGLVFRGIPFASAGRLAPPAPPAVWQSVYEATAFGPQSPQLPSFLDQMLGPAALASAEDCLTLNLWTPAADGEARPVLVWIHGGAFTNGTGAAPWYDGTSFARDGCVLVTVNYRLGAFGFLHLHDAEGPTGNLGLLDQLAALRWVQENISAFGGDPGNVTVFGESAGGASVLAVLSSPLSEGLVRRAWAMSPSITQLRSRERAAEAAAEVLEALGLPVDDAHAVHRLPTEALLDAQRKVLARLDGAFTAFAPTPDGVVVPAAGVVDALGTGVARDIPLVLSTTRDEMALFTAFDPAVQSLDDAGLARRARPFFGERTSEAIDVYRAHRPGASVPWLAAAISTDVTFRGPATRLAEARASIGAPTWLAWFTWPTPVFGGVLGSCHGLDIPFVFDVLGAPGVGMFTGTGAERAAIATAFHGALTAFAHGDDPAWPAYDIERRAVWRIDNPCEVVDDPEPGLRALW